MARLLVAAIALAAMAVSFVVVSLVKRDRHETTPRPVAVAPPPEASTTTAGEPPPATGAMAPAPPTADSRAFMRELARAAAEGEEALRDSLLSLRDADDATIEYKLDVFLRGLQDALEGKSREILRYRGVLTEIFLRIDSVQRDLAALDPGSRQSALDHIRREMGFTDEEVARMQEVDAQREARWQNGLAYMVERERVEATFEGEVLEEELQHLRERHFGYEAETIAREEQQGFFRYERPRIYGRN